MAIIRDPTEKRSAKAKCIMCEGDMESSNFSMICNACKDRMRKVR